MGRLEIFLVAYIWGTFLILCLIGWIRDDGLKKLVAKILRFRKSLLRKRNKRKKKDI